LRARRPLPPKYLAPQAGNRDLLLAAASGVLLGLAFPKAGLWPLAWVGLAPLLLSLRGAGPRRGLLLGYVAGAVQSGIVFYWVTYVTTKYGGMSLLAGSGVASLLALYLAIYPGLFGLGLAVASRAGLPQWVVAHALWVGLERLRGVAFTGFPWAELGASQYPWLHFIQAADLAGVAALSFVIVLANCALAALWPRPTRRALAPVAAAAAALALVLGYGALRLPQVERLAAQAPKLSVAVAQGNIEQALKWRAGWQQESIDAYRDLTIQAAKGHPQLIVWPETALPFYFLTEDGLTREVLAFAEGVDSHLLLGCPAVEMNSDEATYFNRAWLLGPGGRPVAKYDKVHLVPYGEYVPLKRYMPFLGTAVASVGNFQAGAAGQCLDMDGAPPAKIRAKIGVLICFESIFSGLARDAAAHGATLLANITNDAWFGRTSAPYQHFSQAVLRAVETRRAVVRAANTGISGFIGPDGRILASTGLYERTELPGTVPLLGVTTVYTRIGDVPAWACLAVSAGLVGWAWRRRE